MLLLRFFSSTLRIAAYELLRKMGNRFYGQDGLAQVQRLPFGLYIKYHSNSDTLRNEYNALKVLEQKTSILAPRALDIVSQNTSDDDFGYLLTTRVPGTTLAQCQDGLSDQDYDTVSAQLKDYVSQMRNIPKPVDHGIVDWETAGYYPDYWDCTKSMFEGFRWTGRYNSMMQGVFSEFGDYSEELAVETRAWESGDGI